MQVLLAIITLAWHVYYSMSLYVTYLLMILFPYNSKLHVTLLLYPLLHHRILLYLLQTHDVGMQAILGINAHCLKSLLLSFILHVHVSMYYVAPLLHSFLLLNQAHDVCIWVTFYINDRCLMLLYTYSCCHSSCMYWCQLRYCLLSSCATQQIVLLCDAVSLLLAHHTSCVIMMHVLSSSSPTWSVRYDLVLLLNCHSSTCWQYNLYQGLPILICCTVPILSLLLIFVSQCLIVLLPHGSLLHVVHCIHSTT
jgi:hypothetical protein